MIKEYQRSRGKGARSKVIIPDSSHGTNPASVAIVGYEPVVIRSNGRGNIDVAALKSALGTDPNNERSTDVNNSPCPFTQTEGEQE